MGKLFTVDKITLEFGDANVDQGFVEKAFKFVESEGRVRNSMMPGDCDVWGFKSSGKRVQVFEKRKEIENE